MPLGPDELIPLGGAALKGLLGKGNDQILAEQGAALQNRGSKYQLADQAARLPLRGRAIDMILAPQPERENLNAMFSDPGNPYSHPLDRPVAALPMTPLPNGNTPGEQYTDDVRGVGGALPTGQPGDFRTSGDKAAAAYSGPSDGWFGAALAAKARAAQSRLAALPARPAAGVGYYG